MPFNYSFLLYLTVNTALKVNGDRGLDRKPSVLWGIYMIERTVYVISYYSLISASVVASASVVVSAAASAAAFSAA